MSFSHGRTSVFKLEDSGGTTRDVSTYLTGSGLDRSADLVDTTTFQASAKTYIQGWQDGKFTLSGIWDPTVDGYLSGLYTAGTARTFTYYPAGTASSNVSYAGTAICMNYTDSSDIGDANKFTAEFQVVGAVTRAVL